MTPASQGGRANPIIGHSTFGSRIFPSKRTHAESQEADHIETADFALSLKSTTAHVQLLGLEAICIDRADFGLQISFAQKAANRRLCIVGGCQQQHHYTAD